MISKKLAAVVASIILSVPPALSAETVELTSGEVLIGRVVELDDSSLTLQVGFPKVETRTIPRNKVAPTSLYSLLASRIDPQQVELLSIMRVALANMLKWEGFQETVTMLREILRLQKEVERETAEAIERQAADIFDEP